MPQTFFFGNLKARDKAKDFPRIFRLTRKGKLYNLNKIYFAYLRIHEMSSEKRKTENYSQFIEENYQKLSPKAL